MKYGNFYTKTDLNNVKIQLNQFNSIMDKNWTLKLSNKY